MNKNARRMYLDIGSAREDVYYGVIFLKNAGVTKVRFKIQDPRSKKLRSQKL